MVAKARVSGRGDSRHPGTMGVDGADDRCADGRASRREVVADRPAAGAASGTAASSSWMRALDQAFDSAHERKVSLIGVSFGGLIAACYAARRPERVTSLILVSTPSPVWQPRRGDAFCLRFPAPGVPVFRRARDSTGWCRRSIRRATPGRSAWRLRWSTAMRAVSRAVRAGLRGPVGARVAGRRHHRRVPAHHGADAGRHRRGRARQASCPSNARCSTCG